MQYLEVMRGNGRDDYPVRAMWNAVLAGVDARTAKPWTKIKSWFGYGVHLIADTQYEIPVAVNRRPLAAVCQPVEESGSSQPRTRSVVAAVRLLPVG